MGGKFIETMKIVSVTASDEGGKGGGIEGDWEHQISDRSLNNCNTLLLVLVKLLQLYSPIYQVSIGQNTGPKLKVPTYSTFQNMTFLVFPTRFYSQQRIEQYFMQINEVCRKSRSIVPISYIQEIQIYFLSSDMWMIWWYLTII